MHRRTKIGAISRENLTSAEAGLAETAMRVQATRQRSVFRVGEVCMREYPALMLE
jgi:hypothetical protein